MGVAVWDCAQSRFDKELRQIEAEFRILSDMESDLFGISACIDKQIEELYTAVTGEDLGYLSDKERFKDWVDYFEWRKTWKKTPNAPHEPEPVRAVLLGSSPYVYQFPAQLAAGRG